MRRGTLDTRCVQQIQQLLITRGALLQGTGEFGPLTEAAVRQFQTARRLLANGVVDTGTWQALRDLPHGAQDWDIRTQCVDLQRGAHGRCVSALQHLLNHQGSQLNGQGTFGPDTQQQVQRFQQTHGMDSTGVVDLTVKAALYRQPDQDMLDKLGQPNGSTRPGCSMLGCMVILSRGTTATIDQTLQNHPLAAAAASYLVTAAACYLLNQAPGIVRAGCSYLGRKILDQAKATVHDAASHRDCLAIRFLYPADTHQWTPIGLSRDPTCA